MQIHYNDRREAMCNFYEDYVEKRPGREQWGDDDERRQSKEALHVLLQFRSCMQLLRRVLWIVKLKSRFLDPML